MKLEIILGSIVVGIFLAGGLVYFVASDSKSTQNTYNEGENEVMEQGLVSPQKGFLTIEEKANKYTVAPEISSPDGFINTDGEPITLEELRGKVVLLDIWTYSCINCIRTIPHLKEWHEKYSDQGLVIVGLHTPEFGFEKVLSNVQGAVDKLGIGYPVVLDNDFSTWRAYENKYWPRKYLIDIDGYIVYDHIGEGGYRETETALQNALLERSERMGTTVALETGTLAEGGDTALKAREVKSPEVYFGAWRNDLLANGTPRVEGEKEFVLSEFVDINKLYLNGTWNITDEYAESKGETSVVFSYYAKDVFFVAGSEEGVDVDVYLDGLYKKTIRVQSETLYTLIEGETSGVHTLEFRVKEAGLKVFTFTFG